MNRVPSADAPTHEEALQRVERVYLCPVDPFLPAKLDVRLPSGRLVLSQQVSNAFAARHAEFSVPDYFFQTTFAKSHRSFLCQEAAWMAADFHCERRWRMQVCAELATAAQVLRDKRVIAGCNNFCAAVAEAVRTFWSSVTSATFQKPCRGDRIQVPDVSTVREEYFQCSEPVANVPTPLWFLKRYSGRIFRNLEERSSMAAEFLPCDVFVRGGYLAQRGGGLGPGWKAESDDARVSERLYAYCIQICRENPELDHRPVVFIRSGKPDPPEVLQGLRQTNRGVHAERMHAAILFDPGGCSSLNRDSAIQREVARLQSETDVSFHPWVIRPPKFPLDSLVVPRLSRCSASSNPEDMCTLLALAQVAVGDIGAAAVALQRLFDSRTFVHGRQDVQVLDEKRTTRLGTLAGESPTTSVISAVCQSANSTEVGLTLAAIGLDVQTNPRLSWLRRMLLSTPNLEDVVAAAISDHMGPLPAFLNASSSVRQRFDALPSLSLLTGEPETPRAASDVGSKSHDKTVPRASRSEKGSSPHRLPGLGLPPRGKLKSMNLPLTGWAPEEELFLLYFVIKYMYGVKANVLSELSVDHSLDLDPPECLAVPWKVISDSVNFSLAPFNRCRSNVSCKEKFSSLIASARKKLLALGITPEHCSSVADPPIQKVSPLIHNLTSSHETSQGFVSSNDISFWDSGIFSDEEVEYSNEDSRPVSKRPGMATNQCSVKRARGPSGNTVFRVWSPGTSCCLEAPAPTPQQEPLLSPMLEVMIRCAVGDIVLNASKSLLPATTTRNLDLTSRLILPPLTAVGPFANLLLTFQTRRLAFVLSAFGNSLKLRPNHTIISENFKCDNFVQDTSSIPWWASPCMVHESQIAESRKTGNDLIVLADRFKSLLFSAQPLPPPASGFPVEAAPPPTLAVHKGTSQMVLLADVALLRLKALAFSSLASVVLHTVPADSASNTPGARRWRGSPPVSLFADIKPNVIFANSVSCPKSPPKSNPAEIELRDRGSRVFMSQFSDSKGPAGSVFARTLRPNHRMPPPPFTGQAGPGGRGLPVVPGHPQLRRPVGSPYEPSRRPLSGHWMYTPYERMPDAPPMAPYVFPPALGPSQQPSPSDGFIPYTDVDMRAASFPPSPRHHASRPGTRRLQLTSPILPQQRGQIGGPGPPRQFRPPNEIPDHNFDNWATGPGRPRPLVHEWAGGGYTTRPTWTPPERPR